MTWIVVVVLVLFHLVPTLHGNFFESETLARSQLLFGLDKNRFLAGDLWQPLSYALVHANWPHLALNAACIVLIGAKLEFIIGRKNLLLLTLNAALAGAAFYLLLTPGGPAAAILVGASAIPFAYLLLTTTLSPESRFMPIPLSGKSLGIGLILSNLILSLLHPDLPTGPLAKLGQSLTQSIAPDLFVIGHSCHLGGCIAGYLAGRYLLRPRVTLASLQKAREKNNSKPAL